MAKGKKIRTRGKIQLSRYFKKYVEGERVSVVREASIKASFPERLQGRTGVIEEKRGRAYVVRIKDMNKEKKFVIEPIHLKMINSGQGN